ncbi:MAG: glycosyltransferase family 9 protein [Candidatus Fermentibacteria bacterium]|nr:glycosyltransferase family 9 protein [Candidatus Fermentibacteria bacterium]
MLDYLLVRLHSLGDVVLASGTAVAMSQRGKVSFASRARYEPIVKRIPGNVESIPLSGNWRELRRIARNFSTVVDLQNNLTTRLAFAGRNVKRFHFSRRLRRKVLLGAGIVLPWRAEEYLNTWSPGGDPSPVLTRHATPEQGSFTVGIVAGGRWPMKTVPAGVVTELARLFTDIEGAKVLIMGDSEDSTLAEHIVEQCGYRDVRSIAGEGGISQLISRIERLDLLISPDSGPAHIAMALGVPVQVIFTSTSPALGFWPNNFKGAFMVDPVPCRPCHRHGGKKCATGSEQCRRMIVPRDVFQEAMCLVP